MEGIRIIAELMAVSARTAPKSGGVDDLKISILEGEDVTRLCEDMKEYGERHKLKNFDRDGANVGASGAVVLLGIPRKAKPMGLNCAACGYENCKSFTKAEGADSYQFAGPHCMFKMMDLGIAIGSAVKTASILNADNRIMYRIGVVAREKNYMDAELIMGIPLASTGKNIFFDREHKKQKKK